MNAFKKLVFASFITMGSQAAYAGMPVIDMANLGNAVQQLQAWGAQYAQMAAQYTELVNQYNQAVTTFHSLNGVRGMASLVNDPSLRQYLPGDWSQALNVMSAPGAFTGLSGSISSIRNAAKLVDLADTDLDPNSNAGKAFVASQNQAATNRGLGEAGYAAASNRIGDIQTLLDNVNAAPDQKDILDLSARIQAEQVMVQNENTKLMIMSQLQQAQRDITAQQAREIAMQSSKSAGGPPSF